MSVGRLWRRLRAIAGDPVLRRWALIRLAQGKTVTPVPPRTYPPYLAGLSLDERPTPRLDFASFAAAASTQPLVLNLAGESVRVMPGAEAQFVEREFADTESLLALHRFAWIADPATNPAWVGAIWRAWLRRYGDSQRDSWAWHPYTAAERLVNIVRFAASHGLPPPFEDTVAILMKHGRAIAERFEYYDEFTGNHMANNGRGLLLGGLALDRDDWATMGMRVLIEQAPRLFAASGALREGSSHYHLLVCQWYSECSAAAHRARLPEADTLNRIARRAEAVATRFFLPGGLPLIGDVSPDRAPTQFAPEQFVAEGANLDLLARDGWLRLDAHGWSALAFASVDGWTPMPGHAHRDFGSFELHRGVIPVLRDLGRRSYGPAGDADITSSAHNSLTIDGNEPYPINRLYYDAAYRRRITGPAPLIEREADRCLLSTEAFKRLSGIDIWRRALHLTSHGAKVTDEVTGSGRRRIVRHLHTTLPVRHNAEGLFIGEYRVAADGVFRIRPSRRWPAYGIEEPATSIDIEIETSLPWTSTIHVSALPSA